MELQALSLLWVPACTEASTEDDPSMPYGDASMLGVLIHDNLSNIGLIDTGHGRCFPGAI